MTYGTQANIFGGRIEVSGIGLWLGGLNIGQGAQPWLLSRSLVAGISMESNYRNLWLDNIGETVGVSNIGIHGGTNGVGPDGKGDYGMLVQDGGETNLVHSINAHGTYLRAAVVYESARPIARGIKAQNDEAGQPSIEGEPLGVSGPSVSRPDAAVLGTGAQWFDTTLGTPIWSDGVAWVDASGAALSP